MKSQETQALCGPAGPVPREGLFILNPFWSLASLLASFSMKAGPQVCGRKQQRALKGTEITVLSRMFPTHVLQPMQGSASARISQSWESNAWHPAIPEAGKHSGIPTPWQAFMHRILCPWEDGQRAALCLRSPKLELQFPNPSQRACQGRGVQATSSFKCACKINLPKLGLLSWKLGFTC